MSNYSTLISQITTAINTNGQNLITGASLQAVLLQMVSELGQAGYIFGGVVNPGDFPASSDSNLFYAAATAGTYTNFDNIVVDSGELAFLTYSGTDWVKNTIYSTGVTAQIGPGDDADLNIVDELGNILAKFKDGHFCTKNFNSKTAVDDINGLTSQLANTPEITAGNDADLNIADENSNILVEFKDGGIRTSDFDSAEVVSRLENVEAAVPSNYPTQYYGEKIRISGNGYRSNTWGTFTGLPMAQSFSVYGDYIVFVYGSPNYGTGSLWQISTKTKIADLTFPHGTYSAPHGNVTGFSKEFAAGNTDLPLLYVSQWDNEGGCFVYDVKLNGAVTLVQTIMTDGNMGSQFGLALGDWVLDAERGLLYSAKYKVSAYHQTGNAMMFCKFALPAISNSSVVLTAADIWDSFEISNSEADLTITQGKIINNGKMFIISGYGSSNNAEYPASLYVIDLLGHRVASFIDIDAIHPQEPEGMAIQGNSLLYSFGSTTIYSLNF